MELHYTKATFTALWMLAVVLAAVMSDVAPSSRRFNWAALVANLLTVVWSLWNPPMPNMSVGKYPNGRQRLIGRVELWRRRRGRGYADVQS